MMCHHPALDVPEVLLTVFDYVLRPGAAALMTDQPDDNNALIRLPPRYWCPLLTCRFWYKVGSQALLRSVSLHLTNDAARSSIPADSLAACHQICLQFPRQISMANGLEDVFLLSLSEDLRDLATAPLVSMASNPSCPLRELILMGMYTTAQAEQILSLDGVRRHLTLLKVVLPSNDEFFSAHRLLEAATTTAATDKPPCLAMPRLRHLLLYNASLSPLPTGTWKPRPGIRLTTFRLHNVKVDLDHLHQLLLAIATEWLEQVSLRQPLAQNHGFFQPAQFFGQDVLPFSFIKMWAPQCPNLRWLQLGDWTSHEVFITLSHVGSFFPQTERIECIGNDDLFGRPRMVLGHHLTRLEIVETHRHSPTLLYWLHQYLCEERAIHLQELCLPGVQYYSKYLDIGPHLDPAPPSGYREPFDDRTRSWACVSLKHLVLTINPDDHFVLPQFMGGPHEGYARASRGACAFIVSSCPDLRYLELRFPTRPFDLEPEGGVCFLGRLRSLEHLVLRGADFGAQGLPWPYDLPRDRVLIQDEPQSRSSSSSWSSSFLSKARHRIMSGQSGRTVAGGIDLPVLRWMAVQPTDEDRLRQWTNLARCRYLARVDSLNYNAGGALGAHKILLTASKSLWNSHYKVLRPAWTKQLDALLGLNCDSTATRNTTTATRTGRGEGEGGNKEEEEEEMEEGSCWHRLESFTCMIDCANIHLSEGVRARMEVFINQYEQALQGVLPPHVRVVVQRNNAHIGLGS